MSPHDNDTPSDRNSDTNHLATTLIDIGQMTTRGASIVNVFSVLTSKCIELLPIVAAGILLLDNSNSLHVIGSSSHAAKLLDLFQVQNDEGPCRDCCKLKEDVICDDLSSDSRWPNFAILASEQNFSSVYAIPLQAQESVVGALNLFSTSPLTNDQLQTAHSLADAATLVFLQADTQQDQMLVARKLRMAVEGRNAIEQAKGVLSERHGIAMMEAYWKLRDASIAQDMDIVELAKSVVNREISL